jgi:hypothetical protein
VQHSGDITHCDPSACPVFRAFVSRLHHVAGGLHTIFHLIRWRAAIVHHIRAAFVCVYVAPAHRGIFAIAPTLPPITHFEGIKHEDAEAD